MSLSKKNHVSIVNKKFFTFGYPPNELILEEGRSLGSITIAYETYGKLNKAKNNAILITTGITADSHAAEYYSKTDKYPGWWDGLIGPDKAFDTNKYCIICSNVLGGCMGTTGPASIYPITGKPFGMLFPVITIKDIVNVQKKLIDYLGVKKLITVAGGSLGGMQALEWSRSYPEYTKSVIPICCTGRLSAQGIAFNEIGRQTIMSDPNWNKGNYYSKKKPDYGLAIARMIGHITYLSEEKMSLKFGRRTIASNIKTNDTDNQFEIENYLNYKGHTFVERFDANSYLFLTRAMDLFDLAIDDDLSAGLQKLKAQKTLFITISSDWLFPSDETLKIHDILIEQGKDSKYINIESLHGHDGFLIETEKMTPYIVNFLDKV